MDRLTLILKTKFVNGCWEWQGPIKNDGYGTMAIKYKHNYAHRLSYSTFIGPIPEGLQIDHLCRNRKCINPEHLEAVTQAENVLRGVGDTAQRARQTHCIYGHPLTGDNLIVRKQGWRTCKKCNLRRGLESTHKARFKKRVIRLLVLAGGVTEECYGKTES